MPPPIRAAARMTRTASPDRRLAPRPFPAHLASAVGLWLTSRAALPILNSVSLPPSAASGRLNAVLDEIDAFGLDLVARALDDEIARRAQAYVGGIEAYRRHSFRRTESSARVLWREGGTRLLDYGRDGAAPGVLVVPSLINRYFVLDLLPERSFLRHLAGQGLRPFVVDWGVPGVDEDGFDLTAYIERLDRAFTIGANRAGGSLAIIGYCMGGLLALALALRRRPEVTCVALLATPWDFHAGRELPARLLGLFGDGLAQFGRTATNVPVELIQTFFLLIDPFITERKFVRFGGIDPNSEEARTFVAVEDWINDGVPLSAATARDCMCRWYRDNEPARGMWRVAGRKVRPSLLGKPALIVIPGRDRIVPPRSAEALAAQFGSAEILRPALGHVGMMSAARAPALLWTSIAEWLLAKSHRP